MSKRRQDLVLPLGKYFAIRSRLKTEMVLEVKDGKDEPGTPVVLNEEAPLVGLTGDDHQLWHYDDQTLTIRSAINQFCLDVNARDSRVVVQPFLHGGCPTQKWILSENVIQAKDDSDKVVSATDLRLHAPVEVKVRVKVNEPESTGQQWIIDYKPAAFFHIRNHDTAKVLAVHRADPRSGSKVVATRKDSGHRTTEDIQLWYEDRTGVIRSKLNGFVLDSSGEDVVLSPFDETKDCRRWTVAGNSIQNRSNPSLVLEMRPPTTSTTKSRRSSAEAISSPLVVSRQATANPSQFWTFDRIPESSAVRQRDRGKYFTVRSRVSGLVLRGNDSPGGSSAALVATGDREKASDSNALFFLEGVTGTIRNSVNNFCLDVNDESPRLILSSYDPYKRTQQWRIQGKKIVCRQQPDLVLTLDDSEDGDQGVGREKPVSAQIDQSSENQFWDVAYQPAKSFYIVSPTNSKVLTVKATGQRSTSKVILSEKKPKVESDQLWYEDEDGAVTSKTNGFVIEALTEKDGVVRTTPWDPSNRNSQWLIVGNHIQNKHDSRIVLEIHRKNKALCANRFTGDENQRWTFEYV